MKNLIIIIFISLLTVSCSRSQDGKHLWTTAEYYYNTGSLPPPYHYEYEMIISSDGETKLILRLGYSKESSGEYGFTLAADDINRLTECMVKSGLFDSKINSLPNEEIPDGGSTNSIRVTYVNPDPNLDQPPRVYSVPSYPEKEYQEGLNKLYKQIKSLIPEGVRSDMEEKINEHATKQDN